MSYPGEKDDKVFLHRWRQQRDEEEALRIKNVQDMRFLVKGEIWIPGDPEDLKFLQEPSVSNIEWLSGIYRFVLHKKQQVTTIVNEGMITVYIHRLPRDEEEGRIITYMFTLMGEGRHQDKKLLDEMLPPFERYFQFISFQHNYKASTPPTYSDIYRFIMEFLVKDDSGGEV